MKEKIGKDATICSKEKSKNYKLIWSKGMLK